MSKRLITFIFLSILLQIVFSFFYSSNIVNQNNQLYTNQNQFNLLKLEVAEIEKKLTNLSSIKHLIESSSSAQLQFITKKINLTSMP